MSARLSLLSLACLFLAAGAAFAKPPGLPLNPLADGKERMPVELEFFAPTSPATPQAVIGPVGGGRVPMAPAEALTDLLALAWTISR
jgi:hypothetical protein